jgi:hypothetical protein
VCPTDVVTLLIQPTETRVATEETAGKLPLPILSGGSNGNGNGEH